jgi:hypothetical protein
VEGCFVSVFTSLLVVVHKIVKSIGEEECGDFQYSFAGFVLEVDVEVSHDYGCVMGEAVECFSKVGEVIEGFGWEIDSN